METGKLVKHLGLKPGMVVQEFGYDDDVDVALRDVIEDAIDAEMADEDYDDVVDAAVLWWRDFDGDLVDALVDSMMSLQDDGQMWLFTPKAGRDGYVLPSDVAEAATTSGLQAMNSISVANDWVATRLVSSRQRSK